MRRLPNNARDLAEGFHGLPGERKEQILAHLEAMDFSAQSRTIKQILSGAGAESRFLGHLLSKEVPGDREAPENKKKNPIQTK